MIAQLAEPRFQKGARWRHRNLGLLVHIVAVSDSGLFYLAYVDSESHLLKGMSPNVGLNSCSWNCTDLDREFKSLIVLPWHERLDESIDEVSDDVLAEKARQRRLAAELAANGGEGVEEGGGVPPEADPSQLKVDVGDASVFALEVMDI